MFFIPYAAMHLVRQSGNKRLPGFTDCPPAQIVAHGRVLEEGAEGHAAIRVNMEVPPTSDAAGK